MVSYASTNALSMLGGDDYDTIQEEIAVLDASVVHKTGNLDESIDGLKTFTSLPFNVNTGVTNKLNIQTNETTITNPNVFIVDNSTGLTNVKLSDSEVYIKAPNGGSTFDIQGALMRIDGSNPGGLNQLFFGAVNPFSNIEFRNTSMLFLNTDIVITTDSTNVSLKQMGISALSTTTGDLIFLLNKRTGTGGDLSASGYRMIRENATGDFVLQRRTASSGGLSTTTAIQRIDGLTSETFTMPTQTKVASTAFKVQTVSGTDKLNIAPSTTTLTNTNIANVTTGSFVVQNPSGNNKVYVDSTATEIVNNEVLITANTANIALLMGPTGSLVVQNNTLEKLNIGTSTTTITNTSINATGAFYASRYFCGSSGGSNVRLASLQLPLGTCLIPTGSATPSTVTGQWSYTGTSTQMRTPEWGYFYPLYALIGLDNGTITGGGVMTLAIRIREETNNYDYSTDAFTITTSTSNTPTGAASNFTTFSAGSNSRISGGVLIRFQIVLTRTLNISASSKSCYATVYGYQTS